MDSPDLQEESWMPYDSQEYFTVERGRKGKGGGGRTGRASTCMNDDDYDYAIELKLDDEYRQAADALPSIAEFDLDDDELLIMLEEKRRSIDVVALTTAASGGSGNGRSPHLSPHKGIVKYLRESLSPSFSRRRSNSACDNCVIDVVPSPVRGEPGQDLATDVNKYTDNGHNTHNNDSNSNANNNGNDNSISNSPANVQYTSTNRSTDNSPLRALSPKRLTPLRKAGNTPSNTPGNSPMNEEELDPNSMNNSVNKNRDSDRNCDEKEQTLDQNQDLIPDGNNENNDEKDENRWSLTALWNATKESARPISLRLVAAANTVRQMRANEPLNPVTSLFEPATIISSKGLLVMSTKGKMDIKEIKRSRSNKDKHSSEGNTPLPPGQFLGWRSPGTQIWARLKMAGLDVKCVFSWDLRRIILKIRCPQRRLEEVAERMNMKLKNREGAIRRFKVSRRDTFRPDGYSGTIFRSTERQQIIDFIIRSKIKDGGAELDEYTELGNHIIQRFPLHMYVRLIDIRHVWVTFWKREKAGEIPQQWSPFSIPLAETLSRFGVSIGYVFKNILTQPLDSIAEYFGEAIAFYFAYTAFYTKCLVWPAVLGIAVFCCQIHAGNLDHWTCLPYSVFVMVWACLTLALWGQHASTLAYRWGMLDFEAEETERPQFLGTHLEDLEGVISTKRGSGLSGFGPSGSKGKNDNELRKAYPMWRRFVRYCFTIPPVMAALAVILIVMSTVFTTQDKLFYEYEHNERLNFRPEVTLFSISFRGWPGQGTQSVSGTSTHSSGPAMNTTMSATTTTASTSSTWGSKISPSNLRDPNFWTVTFLYPCIYGILVDVAVKIFALLALRLTNFENHRTQTTFMNRLILKVFSFRFITIFTSLYYYAFFTADHEGAYVRISVTVFSLITVGQWWGALIDICFPSIVYRAMMYRMKVNVLAVNRNIYRAREYADAAKGTRGASLKTAVDKRAGYLDQARAVCWAEAMQFQYNNFHDYSTMIVQFCFVLFFSSVFPLAPLIALLNNVILLRVSAYKVCYTRQRPIALKSAGLGVWEDVLQVMSVVGILTNCGIMGYTSTVLQTRLAPIIGVAGMVISLFALEHTILFVKYWLSAAIPRVPIAVQRLQARDRRSLGRKKQVRQEEKKKRRTMFSDHFFPSYFDDDDDNMGDVGYVDNSDMSGVAHNGREDDGMNGVSGEGYHHNGGRYDENDGDEGDVNDNTTRMLLSQIEEDEEEEDEEDDCDDDDENNRNGRTIRYNSNINSNFHENHHDSAFENSLEHETILGNESDSLNASQDSGIMSSSSDPKGMVPKGLRPRRSLHSSYDAIHVRTAGGARDVDIIVLGGGGGEGGRDSENTILVSAGSAVEALEQSEPAEVKTVAALRNIFSGASSPMRGEVRERIEEKVFDLKAKKENEKESEEEGVVLGPVADDKVVVEAGVVFGVEVIPFSLPSSLPPVSSSLPSTLPSVPPSIPLRPSHPPLGTGKRRSSISDRAKEKELEDHRASLLCNNSYNMNANYNRSDRCSRGNGGGNKGNTVGSMAGRGGNSGSNNGFNGRNGGGGRGMDSDSEDSSSDEEFDMPSSSFGGHLTRMSGVKPSLGPNLGPNLGHISGPSSGNNSGHNAGHNAGPIRPQNKPQVSGLQSLGSLSPSRVLTPSASHSSSFHSSSLHSSSSSLLPSVFLSSSSSSSSSSHSSVTEVKANTPPNKEREISNPFGEDFSFNPFGSPSSPPVNKTPEKTPEKGSEKGPDYGAKMGAIKVNTGKPLTPALLRQRRAEQQSMVPSSGNNNTNMKKMDALKSVNTANNTNNTDNTVTPDAWQVQFAERLRAIETRKKIYSVARSHSPMPVIIENSLTKVSDDNIKLPSTLSKTNGKTDKYDNGGKNINDKNDKNEGKEKKEKKEDKKEKRRSSGGTWGSWMRWGRAGTETGPDDRERGVGVDERGARGDGEERDEISVAVSVSDIHGCGSELSSVTNASVSVPASTPVLPMRTLSPSPFGPLLGSVFGPNLGPSSGAVSGSALGPNLGVLGTNLGSSAGPVLGLGQSGPTLGVNFGGSSGPMIRTMNGGKTKKRVVIDTSVNITLMSPMKTQVNTVKGSETTPFSLPTPVSAPVYAAKARFVSKPALNPFGVLASQDEGGDISPIPSVSPTPSSTSIPTNTHSKNHHHNPPNAFSPVPFNSSVIPSAGLTMPPRRDIQAMLQTINASSPKRETRTDSRMDSKADFTSASPKRDVLTLPSGFFKLSEKTDKTDKTDKSERTETSERDRSQHPLAAVVVSTLTFEQKLQLLEEADRQSSHPLAAALMAVTRGGGGGGERGERGDNGMRGEQNRGGKIVRAFSPARTGDASVSVNTVQGTPQETRMGADKGERGDKGGKADDGLKMKSVRIEEKQQKQDKQERNYDQHYDKNCDKHHERENIAKLANLQTPPLLPVTLPHYQQPLIRSAMAGSRAKLLNTPTPHTAHNPSVQTPTGHPAEPPGGTARGPPGSSGSTPKAPGVRVFAPQTACSPFAAIVSRDDSDERE